MLGVNRRIDKNMSGLDNLKTRINWNGGGRQQERMNLDKVRSLKKALIYSYQAATAIMSDGREFRCLINPNKLSLDLDNKFVSMLYKDICLNEERIGTTSEGEVETGIKPGEVFTWKENGSHWLVYLQRLEETAYFRAEIRRCRHQIEINGKKYWVYLRGPVEQTILWAQTSNNYYNKLNYSGVMLVPNNEETKDYFHRFTKIKIDGRPWEVQMVDDLSTEGVLEVAIKETYTNTIEDDIERAVEESKDIVEVDDRPEIYIAGPDKVKPYDIKTYYIQNYKGRGSWSVANESRPNIVKAAAAADTLSVSVEIITGRRNSFELVYKSDDGVVSIVLPIEIESL